MGKKVYKSKNRVKGKVAPWEKGLDNIPWIIHFFAFKSQSAITSLSRIRELP